MKTENLKKLRELRTQEKAIKASIENVMPLAKEEAKLIHPEGGKFSIDGVGEFVMDIVPVYNLDDYRRYKEQDAIDYRAAKRAKTKLDAQSKQKTAQMRAARDSFALLTDKEPDSVSYNLKCIGLE